MHSYTHTSIRTFKHTLIVREKEKGPNMFIYMYKVSQRRRWDPASGIALRVQEARLPPETGVKNGNERDRSFRSLG